jgi:hypothetical protein
VVWPLWLAYLPFKAHNLHAIFAQGTVHMRAPLDTLMGPLQEEIGDVWMYPHVMRREHLDLRITRRQACGGVVNTLHENAVKEQKWQHDEALLTQACSSAQAVGDKWLCGP